MDSLFYAARQADERAAREASGQDTPLFTAARSNFEADHLKAEGALIFRAERAAETLRRRVLATKGDSIRISRDELAQIADHLGRIASIAGMYHAERVA